MAESQGGKEVYPAPPAGADWDRGAVVESSDHPIEAGSDDFEEDEFLETGWDATSAAASTAASSNVYRHEYEHGRRYHSYKHGRYPIPNDDEEQHRMDMKHVMMMEITDGKLFYAPIGDHPQKILDMGTGTGLWAMEVADIFPSAEVLGVDLSPIQPSWVPPNLKFVVDDLEDDWVYGSGWDYVHFRDMAVHLQKLQKTIDQVFTHLKPGGYIEFQESCGDPQCDDGTMPEDDILRQYFQASYEGMSKYGMDITKGRTVHEELSQAGFVNINCVVKRLPLGLWPRDKTMRLVGQYARMAALDGVELTIMGKPFAPLGLSQIESQVWAAKIRQAFQDDSVHRYYNFYFWMAQKPE